jgi:hypothetical protein
VVTLTAESEVAIALGAAEGSMPSGASISESVSCKIGHDDSYAAGTFKEFEGWGRHELRKGISDSWRGFPQVELDACGKALQGIRRR